MPTQTKFICPSGGVNVDLSGIFADLDGGVAYGTATKFKVGANDFNTIFHASTSAEDRPSFNTGYKITVNGTPTDLSTIFRRRGFVSITITSQPSNQIVVNNAQAQFSVTATGSGVITYQWRKNGADINGATSSTYTIANATLTNDGSYDCVISSGGQSVTSNSALLKIKPYIVSHPSALYVNDGVGPYALQTTAGGSQVLYFSWYRNGIQRNAPRPGNLLTTQDQDVLNPVNSTNTGNYYCKVTSDYDAVGVDTNTVSVLIIPPIVTISSFGNQTQFNEGNTVQFSSSISQGTNITYQWYRNNSIISGATSSTYNFAISGFNTGTYKVRATNGGGFDDSNEIAISIIPPIVNISSTQYIYNNGNAVQLTSSLSQGANATYQWYGPAGLINGATSSNYVFTMSASTYGNYYVRATNAGGFDDSNVVTMYMNPIITVDPNNQTSSAGSTASFSVSAAGSPTLSYQWYKNGGLIFGATSNSYTTPTLTSSDNQSTYYCIVSSSVSGTTSDTSNSATLTVNYAPAIGSTKFNGTTLSYNLQSFGVSNGSQFTIEIANVDDGNPNGSGSWYKWNGSTYVSLGVASYSHTLSQDDNSTDYYRYQLSNAYGTAYSYEIEVVTS
jgi:hypothetical protein